jgi:DNA polymerase III subunit alpha
MASMSKFKQICNPHSHSDYSLDGASSVEQIVDRNLELGATHVTLTEHGNINSAMELYSTCQKKGAKPILGVELYVEPFFADQLAEMWRGELSKKHPSDKLEAAVKRKMSGEYFHLTIHFKDLEAYQYFCRISGKMEERAIVKYGERKPVCTIAELQAISGHITIGSGCLGGMVQRWIDPLKNHETSRPDLAEQSYLRLKEIAGPGNFFVELFPHHIETEWKAGEKDKAGNIIKPGKFEPICCNKLDPTGDIQRPANRFVLEMARKYGDPVIISLDSHFALPEQKVCQDARLGNGEERWKMSINEYIMTTDECADELKHTLNVSDRDIEEFVENSYQFAALFNDFKLQTSKDRWALEPAEPNFLQKIKEAIDKHGRMDWSNQEMLNRLKLEMDVLAFNPKLNLIPYLFKVEEIADFCRRNNILINVRGSAGGSLLMYLIGVSAVNPLKHNLSFARFITPGRIAANTLPDVDIDISTSGRERVLEYLEQTYGDRFCRISTDALMKLKSAIKDAERAMKGVVSKSTEDLCRTLPNEPQNTESYDFVFGADTDDGNHHAGLIDTNPKLKAYADANKEIWRMVTEMLGIKRQKGIHACGVCIADKPVQEYSPIIYINDTKATGFSPKSVELAGLVKYDLLGLNTLDDIQGAIDSIQETVENIYKETGVRIKWNDLPHDQKSYDEFGAGHTETVFQFDTPTVRPYLIAIRPQNIEDLAAITSLCRPGCLDAPYTDGRTLADVYVARSQGEPIKYIHDDLESITGITKGIALYQEQSIEMFKKMANYSDEQAETVRRGIGKKEKKVLESCMNDLKNGCLSRGWNPEQFELLKEQIMASANYAFNKSHGVSYAYVAYACMYLKTNYKLHWWKSVLTNATKKELATKFWKFVKDFTKLPDINRSTDGYQIIDDYLVAPLSILNGIGPKAYEQLVQYAPYTSLEHFVKSHFHKAPKKSKKAVAGSPVGPEKLDTVERSAVHTGVARKLVAGGVLDSLFTKEQLGLSVGDRLVIFEEIKARVKEEKPEEIPPEYRGVTSLGEYMLRKQLVSIYSDDITPIVMPNRGGYQDQQGRWRMQPRPEERHGTPLMTGEEIQRCKDRADAGMGYDMWCAAVAYVIEEKAKMYQNKTKQATVLFVDIAGVFFEEIVWPKYGTNMAATGYRGLPVILLFKSTQDRFQIKKIYPILDKTQIDTYNVL